MIIREKTYTFDIEGNGLYPEVTTVHCICIKDFNTGKEYNFRNTQLDKALAMLSEADTLIGHNIIDYDMRALKKVFPDFGFKDDVTVFDTFVWCRSLYHDIKKYDDEMIEKGQRTKEDYQYKNADGRTLSLQGRHSLKAYGVRFAYPKDDYDGGWEEFNEEMFTYCIRDVALNHKLAKQLYKKREQQNYPYEALELDTMTQAIVSEQVTTGWLIDFEFGTSLYAELADKRKRILDELRTEFKDVKVQTKTPAFYYVDIENNGSVRRYRAETKLALKELYWPKYKGIRTLKFIESRVKAGPLKINTVPFNPASSIDIAREFKKKYGWEDYELTPNSGDPQINTEVLKTLEFDEAKKIVELYGIQDAIEKLAEGKDSGYLHQICEEFRIHGYLNILGAHTHRATHSGPNMAQVTSINKPYGKELRSLFTAKKGYVIVGTDASQQEIRVLAHYLYPYDNGEYASVISTTEDIHTDNQRVMGLATRNEAKTAIYAILYGQGLFKIGSAIGVTDEDIERWGPVEMWGNKESLGRSLTFLELPPTDENLRTVRKGKEIKATVFKNFIGLQELVNLLQKSSSANKFIRSLDDRIINNEHHHKALNYLIQSTGAVITKRWMVIIDQMLREAGIKDYVHQVAWVHDELQYEVREDLAEQVGQICQEAMTKVEEFYDFKCPLTADFKIGNNWSETH